MKLLRSSLLLLVLGQALLGRSEDKQQPEATATTTTPKESKDYVRFVEDEKGARLETGISTFRNAEGVTVDLIGAIHVADHAYYQQLNERFAKYEAVLYEMVGGPVEKRAKRHSLAMPKFPPKDKTGPGSKAMGGASLDERIKALEDYFRDPLPKPGQTEAAPEKEKSTGKEDVAKSETLAPEAAGDDPDEESENAASKRLSWLVTLTSQLQKSLGLESQLSGVNYFQPNFVHADMSLTQFFKLQDQRNEGFLKLWFKAVKTQLAHPELTAQNQPGLLKILEILCRNDSAVELKRIVGRTFDNVEALMTGIEGDNGTVIIAERNKIALGVLDKQVAEGKKNLAIFYGSAHLQDMQKRLAARGFTRVKHEWLTAWDLPPEPKESPAPNSKTIESDAQKPKTPKP